MMKRICEDLRPKIPGYLEGDLLGGERQRLEQHLEACALCRAEMKEHKETWGLLDHYPEIAPSADFVPNLLLRARRLDAAQRRQRIRRTVVALAAGLLLSVFLLLYTLTGVSESGLTSGSDAALEAELLENLDLLEDLDFLVEYGEDLDLVMEYDLFHLLSEGESL
jgi:anti-sigma factor RsiW